MVAGDNGIDIQVKRLAGSEDLPLPEYMSNNAAGMDVSAAVEEEVILAPGERQLIPTGLIFSIPQGYEGQVRPRSGLALHNGITLLNSPGTIDADYRGEVKIIIANMGEREFRIKRGDRIAQVVFCPVMRARLEFVEELDETTRGKGGFGHSGQ